jgi:hypothetical protein
MKPLISFTEFIRLPKSVQESMGRLDNEYLQEELSPTAHKKKMVELERALKNKDWWWFMSDSGIDYKRGKSEEDKIKGMRDALGDDGNLLYKQYAIKSGVVSEARKDPRPSSYEKFLYKKMKEWKIKSLDELEGEAKTRFDQECTDEYEGDGEDEVEVNLPENRSMFPEMNQVTREGLGYGEERPVGGKSKHGFVDAGNLYPEHLVPKWIPPSPQRTRGWSNK